MLFVVWCSSTNKEQAVILMQESASVWWIEKIEMLQEARKLDRSNPEITEQLAQEATKQWYYDVATTNYTTLESLDWYVDEWRLWRIEVALIQWDETTASQIIELYTPWERTSELLVTIGWVYYDNTFLLEASNIFEEAITTDVTNSKARTNMGVVQADLWELEMAKEFMDEASKLDPTNTTIQFNRATLLGDLAFQARKKWAESTIFVIEALEIVNDILSESEDNQEVELYRAVLLFENQDYDQSRELLEVLSRKYSSYEDVWYYLGVTYKEIWEIEKARDAFLELLTIDPSHPRAAQELIDLGAE